MRKLVVLFVLSLAMVGAAADARAAESALRPPLTSYCSIKAYRPFIAVDGWITARVTVFCTKRMSNIQLFACLVRYGSELDETPFFANDKNGCKGVRVNLDDRVATTVRHRCAYTTFSYIWRTTVLVYIRNTGYRTASKVHGSPAVYAACQ